jgi:methionyl aminopeptidase
VSEEDATLIATTKEATESAIAMCKPGVLYRDIGNKIESIVKLKGYGIVRQYTAHGINQLVGPATEAEARKRHMADILFSLAKFHCAPYPVHYGGSKTPGKMEAGQIFTIEPMINGGVASLDHWRE